MIAHTWQPVPDQESVSGVQFQDIVWTGERFVATAVVLGGGAAFLDSTDGRHWHLQSNLGPTAFPAGLAAGPRGVVVIGNIGDHPASWASVDGLTWTAQAGVFPGSPTGSDTITASAVVATDDGWLAVGHEDPECHINCGLEPVRALVWTSSNGLRWTQVANQAAFKQAGMEVVVRGGPGFVAAGSTNGHAAIWSSPTGSTWSRVADDPMFHARKGVDLSYWMGVQGLASGWGVVVAVGMDGAPGGGDSSVGAWWSVDGRTWARAKVDHALNGQVFDVTGTPSGFLATGPSGEDSCLGGIWASTDGRGWTCDAADPSFQGFGPYAAAASESIEVAVGLTSSDEETPNGLPGAAWWRPLP